MIETLLAVASVMGLVALVLKDRQLHAVRSQLATERAAHAATFAQLERSRAQLDEARALAEGGPFRSR